MPKHSKVMKPKKAKTEEQPAETTNAPSQAMVALFNRTASTDATMAKLERRNMPQMVKPGDVPMGGVVSGRIHKIVQSPVATVKGQLLWLQHTDDSGNVTEFTFPCTGVIRNALAPGVEAGKELTATLEKEIGKMFYAKRCPDKTSAKYKKSMFMFDVFTSDK